MSYISEWYTERAPSAGVATSSGSQIFPLPVRNIELDSTLRLLVQVIAGPSRGLRITKRISNKYPQFAAFLLNTAVPGEFLRDRAHQRKFLLDGKSFSLEAFSN